MNNTLLLWLLNILKETLVNNTLLLANEYSQRNLLYDPLHTEFKEFYSTELVLTIIQ
jgi:hypothetical protein